MLRVRIVRGVLDEGLQKKLFSEPNLTFDSALEIGVASETATKNVENIPISNHTSIAYIKTLHQKRSDNKFTPCHHSTQLHGGTKCNFKDPICYYCNKRAHINKACFIKNKNDKTATPSYVK